MPSVILFLCAHLLILIPASEVIGKSQRRGMAGLRNIGDHMKKKKNFLWHVGPSDVRARAWPKAQAWAGLEWAQACKNPEPGPKPELGLGWAGLGLEPGLFAYHGIMNKYDK